jgi:RNA polymerase sigma factor (sigma-70 family)
MARGQAGIILQHVRQVLEARGADRLSDRDLLQRYAQQHDQAAFATLVCRHGPMVLQVCQRILHHCQDAEDAFQTTFLTLARKATSGKWQDSVGPWLYMVAYRLALRSRASADRRARLERYANTGAPTDPQTDAGDREFFTLFHEQLGNLPEQFRAPVVLCCLEGFTRDQAARELGWSLGTLKRRLERGRELLRQRLLPRGVGAAALAGVLGGPNALPDLPTDLLDSTTGLIEGFCAATGPVATVAGGFVRSRVVAAMCALLAGLSACGLLLAFAAGPPRPASPKAQPEAKVAANDQPGQVPGTDRLGDPLPQGALARLGTSRLRGNRVRFLPGGRSVIREQGGDLQISEVPTGKPLALIRARDVPNRTFIVGSTIDFTRDGKYLAGVCWEGRCGIWETATGKLVRWIENGKFYSLVRCNFSAEGKYLAVGSTQDTRRLDDMTVGVYEAATGNRLFTVAGSNSVFAPDGKSLVTWNGYMGFQQARRVEVPSGKELSTFPTGRQSIDFAIWFDGVWFFDAGPNGIAVREVATGEVKHTLRGPRQTNESPVHLAHVAGRPELIAVGNKPARVWCWDINTGKELWQAPLGADHSYYPRLSEDGKTLVTGDSGGTVRVWDVASGKQRASFRPQTIGHESDGPAFSGDGKTIATTSGGIFTSAVTLWDATTGKVLSDLPGHPSAITAAAFSPDGAKVYTIGKDRTLRTWDPASGRELARFRTEPAAYVAVSPDGKTLFAAGADSGMVRILDPQTGRENRRLPAFTQALVGLALTADGKQLVIAGRDKEVASLVRVHDATTLAKLREFPGPDAKMELLAVRSDGGRMATTHVGRRVLLWDTLGKKLNEQVGHSKRQSAWVQGETPFCIGAVALSPEGRWLAYTDQDQGVAIVNAHTGREAGRFRSKVYFQTPAARYDLRDVLAFSPDGKTVAWSGAESTTEVFLIEARSQEVRRVLRADTRPVQQMVFSPDGTRLLTSGPDGAALIWDVRGRPEKATKPPSTKQIAGWWDLLAEASAHKAYQAMQEMTAHPSAAVALLRKKFTPVAAVKPATLDALIAGLDADDFKDREKATQELVALADAAEPRLRAELAKSSSLEVKRRAQQVLTRIQTDRLRPERAVEVLERIGDVAALKLLKELTGGMPGAARTTDAAGAVSRLSRAITSGALRTSPRP